MIVFKSLIKADKHINSKPYRQLKKILIEISLVSLRFLMVIKIVLVKLATWLFKPILSLIKFFLYKPFLNLYYLIFRIKKYDLKEQSKLELFRKKSFHFIALLFVIIAVLFNLQNQKPASAALGKPKISVMEEVVRDEFNDVGQNHEELIQENASNNFWTSLANNLYVPSKGMLSSNTGIGTEEILSEDLNSANNQGTILKPKQLALETATTPTNQESENQETKRSSIIQYTIQSGDTISTIARRFNLNVNTVLWANNLTAFSIIRPGKELTILPTDGFLYKVKSGDTLGRLAQTYDTAVEKIISSNNLASASSIRIGQELIIPGIKRSSSVTSSSIAKNTSASGLNVIKEIVSSETPSSSSNKMAWPTSGHRITQYFSWSHNGLDIGEKVGTPIYAADDGVVEISQGGWNGGYGNTILLDHGGGKKTRYGHASKLLVSKGDSVEKGQLIALIGSTGRSTGPHLHFEVVINGKRYNPLNYIR